MRKKSYEKGMTRRSFLKASAGAVALAGIGTKLFENPMSSLFTKVDPKTNGESTWHKGYCSACISPNCNIMVEVRDGVAVQLIGDPQGAFNKGTLCPRGAAGIAGLYNPYRVKSPLKRTNPERSLDNDPGWVEISWDEALNTVAEKLKAVRASDPRTFVSKFGFSSLIHESALPALAAASMGSPNNPMTAGPLCTVHYSPIFHHGVYVDKVDLGYCNYLISIGNSIGGDAAFASGPTRALADAIQRGMKFVTINPRAGFEASMGEWIPIRPGTDLAMGLAMLYVILYELNTYDVMAVKSRTNGPYLIGPDGDYVRDPMTQKPLMFNTKKGIVPFDDPDTENLALEGYYDVNGVLSRPAFDLIKEHAKQYTPEWQEPITTIPAETIRRLMREYVNAVQIGSTIVIDGVEFPYRPAALVVNRGAAAHIGGRSFHWVTGMINAMMGAADVPGALAGLESGPQILQSGPDGTIEAVVNPTFTHYYHGTPWKFPPDDLELKEFFPISLGTVQVSNRAIINPEKYYIPYKVEALMSYGENGIMNNANSDEVVESYKHIPFVFNIAYHFDEPTMLADIVLPEPSNLERWAIYMATPCRSAGSDTYGLYSTNFRYPVVSPVYNTMQAEDIYNEIADRAGFLFGPGGVNFFWNIMLQLPPDQGLALDKKYTWKEIVDIRLKGMYGPDKGADYFKQESFIAKQLPLSQAYNYFYHPEARVEIYARSLQDVGRQLKVNLEQAGVTVPGWNMDDFFFYYQPMPDWKDTHLQTAPAEFDLYIINWKISPRNIGISGQDDNVWLREIVEKWDATGLYLLMNADTAKAKGIHDGDRVIVESQHGGRVDGLVRTSQLIHPEVLGTAGQAGHRSLQLNPVSRHGFLFNYLLTADDGLFCQSSGGLDGTARVKVYKA